MGRRAKAAPSRNQNRSQGARRKKKGEYNGEDFDDLVAQLRPLGLVVRKMEGDGNCLFRAFADQITGDCEEHQQFRDECCDIMLEQAAEFELFHADEDEEESLSFEAYVQRMRHPGKWGCQLELMALCRQHNVNAIVHQCGRPAYEMGNAPRDARCIQLSYHDGEHYNSIRFAWDIALGQPVQHLSLQQLRPSAGEDADEDTEDVLQVREFLPPDHHTCATAIRAALVRASGDASVAAEYLLVETFGDGAALACAPGSASDAAEDRSQEKKPAAARQCRGDKKLEKRLAKEAAEQGKKICADSDDIDDKISLLGKQLLSV